MKHPIQINYCRVAPSLGALEADHKEVWGTYDYGPWADMRPAVFFGLYDLRDYLALRRHKGKKWVLWAGSDLENLKHGFIFNDGKLRKLSFVFKGFFRSWLYKILKSAEHYVEDQDEFDKLFSATGIEAKIAPSFLGKISDFPVHFHETTRPKVYMSTGNLRDIEYGVPEFRILAAHVPECDFHVYGSSFNWKPIGENNNFFNHGRVSKEQFNREIQEYHCGLRFNKSDGFSEVTAKSILMGQYPITFLEYPMISNFKTREELISLVKSLKELNKPNHIGRDYYIKALNNYPWVRHV